MVAGRLADAGKRSVAPRVRCDYGERPVGVSNALKTDRQSQLQFYHCSLTATFDTAHLRTSGVGGGVRGLRAAVAV